MKLKNEKIMDNQRIHLYHKNLTYIKDRIRYYKINQHEKGSAEAIEWIESFTYVKGLSLFKQSKFNRNLIKLVLITCDQEFIYKMYDLKNKYKDESIGLLEFTNRLRSHLSGQKRSKLSQAIINENIMKIDESVYRSKLDMQLRKQKEIMELNENEKYWLEKASDQLKSKIEAKGIPTFSEIIDHGKVYCHTDSELNVSVTVTCKLYGYYWVMVASRARYTITPDKHYKMVPYLTSEQAFQKAKEMFNEEVALQIMVNKKADDKIKAKEKEREKVDVDISNVARAMGIVEDEEEVEDIF